MPSGARSPASVVPSHASRTGRPGAIGRDTAIRRTGLPLASMIVTVTSSRSFTRTRIVLRSRRPSPSGEKFLTR